MSLTYVTSTQHGNDEFSLKGLSVTYSHHSFRDMQRSIVLTAPGYTPLSWCSVLYSGHYPNFHMYLFYRSSLRCQTPIWSYIYDNWFHRCQEYQFLFWNGHSRYTLRWTLLFCSSAAMMHGNQSATSTWHDPVRSCGIGHQRSESTRN